MPNSNDSNPQRPSSSTNTKQSILFFVLLAVLWPAYWFLLPAVQSLIIPQAPGGNHGPWVVRPGFAFQFCAATALAAVTVPLLAWPIRRRWKREEAAVTPREISFLGRSVSLGGILAFSIFLTIVYVTGLIYYLFSWTTIGPDGIEERLPWATHHHSFQDIVLLEMVPEGEYSPSLRQNGPRYSIKMKNGRVITLDGDTRSIREDFRAITAYVAARSGLAWVRRSDSEPR